MERIKKNSGLLISLFIVVMLAITSCEKKVDIELEKFSPKFGRFSVMAPGAFVRSTQNIETDVGSVVMITFMINKPNVVYIASYIDYPSGVLQSSDPDDMLANGRNEMLKKIDGKLISEERIAYDKDPGVEIRYTLKGGTGLGHTMILLSGNRLYQVGGLGAKSSFPAESVKQYIDSFEVW